MPKKEILEEEVKEVVETPALLNYDFGRQDLNELQAAVNYLLSKGA